jgi:hypothetical protein
MHHQYFYSLLGELPCQKKNIDFSTTSTKSMLLGHCSCNKVLKLPPASLLLLGFVVVLPSWLAREKQEGIGGNW